MKGFLESVVIHECVHEGYQYIFTLSLCTGTVFHDMFVYCTGIGPDLDGYRAPKMKH